MTKIICDIEAFKQYIYDSSAAIFSEESNKAYNWYRNMSGILNFDGHTYELSIKTTAAEGHKNDENFIFIFDLELTASVTKTEAREMICSFADAAKFHPNINVADNTDHGRAVVSERCFWLQPAEFKCRNYCWDEIPERADRWRAQISMTVKQTPSPTADTWGRSFDLNPDPVRQLRAAIRNRDEEIARKEAERKAKEEADRLAAEKAERELQEAYEKLKNFLESIGDFEVHGPSSHDPDCGEAVAWLETMGARIIPFKELCHDEGDLLWIGSWNEPDTPEILLRLHIRDGFDKNVQKIIKWMVENGAREPKSEAA